MNLCKKIFPILGGLLLSKGGDINEEDIIYLNLKILFLIKRI